MAFDILVQVVQTRGDARVITGHLFEEPALISFDQADGKVTSLKIDIANERKAFLTLYSRCTDRLFRTGTDHVSDSMQEYTVPLKILAESILVTQIIEVQDET